MHAGKANTELANTEKMYMEKKITGIKTKYGRGELRKDRHGNNKYGNNAEITNMEENALPIFNGW